MADAPSEKISRTKKIFDELLRRKREGLFCRKCSRYFAKRPDFNQHLKEHLKETYGSTSGNLMDYIENYICSKCGQQFEVKSDLIIHYNTACIDAHYMCKHCKENCETFPFLQVHLAFYHNYTEEMLRSEGFLTNLENDNFDVCSFMARSIHKAFNSSSPDAKDESRFEDVGSSTSAKKAYSRKFRKPLIKSNKNQNLAFNSLDKTHICEICNESFSRKCVLEIHALKHISIKNVDKKTLRDVSTKDLPVQVSEINSVLPEITIKEEEITDDPEVTGLTSNVQKSNLELSNMDAGTSFWKKTMLKRKLVKSSSPKNGTQKCKKTAVIKVKAEADSKPKAVSQLSNKCANSSKWNKVKLKIKLRNVENSDNQKDPKKSNKMEKPKSLKIKKEEETKSGEEKVYPCELCNKKFKDGYKLRRHFLIHTGVRPFTCTKCKKTFVRDDHLKRHVKRVCSKTEKAQ